MKTAGWLLLLVVGGVAACSGEAPPPQGGGASATALPDAFHGRWELTGTSGGLDGRGLPVPEGDPPRILVTGDNTLERRAPDGRVVRQRFAVRRGRSIFGTDETWMIALEGGGEELVLELAPGGTLTLAENVYDGFSSTYRRVTE